jgi:hypothetical protein
MGKPQLLKSYFAAIGEPVNDFLLREVLRVRHMGLLAGLSIMLCGYDRKGLCKIKIRNSNQATGGMFANSVILSL